MMNTTVSNKFNPSKAMVAFQAVTTYQKTAAITLGSKYLALHDAGVRHTDFVASTTRWEKDQWDSAKILVRQSFVDVEMRRVALLSKADYKAELATLEGKGAQTFQDLRNACATKVGSKMRDFAAALLLLDTPAEQAKVAKDKETAKAARTAKKIAKEPTLSGKDAAAKLKIVFDTAALIVKGDEEPAGYKPADMMKSINAALALLSQ